MPTTGNRRYLAVALAAVLAYSSPALAEDCLRSQETEAFILRHLQSQLMVAALSCNQSAAYNTFVQHFEPQLTEGGRALTAYFARVGGGMPALNKYVTEIANAAGLSRAADPQGFCAKTWELFWNLEQMPDRLLSLAAATLTDAIRLPQSCAAKTSAGVAIKTAAPQEAVAAVK